MPWRRTGRSAAPPATRIPSALPRSRRCPTSVPSSRAPSWRASTRASSIGSWSSTKGSPGTGRPTGASPRLPGPSPARTGTGHASSACATRPSHLPSPPAETEQAVKSEPKKSVRCAIYTRVSSDQGLEQDFNSLDNQREAAEAYIKSPAHEGWRCLPAQYNDGGFSGATLERPALQKLLADVRARLIDVVVVYKVDRLTRSLADFAKLIESFEAPGGMAPRP